MYILNMKNSKFIIDKFAKLIEQGLVSSKDLTCAVTAGWVIKSSPAAAVKFKFLAA